MCAYCVINKLNNRTIKQSEQIMYYLYDNVFYAPSIYENHVIFQYKHLRVSK